MIKMIYKELPIEEINYLTRNEFINGEEKEFYTDLKNSMSKYGFRDPVHIVYGDKIYGDIFKVIVGNNRMVIAKELGIKIIPSIITNFKADTFNIEGKVLENDDEIKKYFYLPNELQIRRDEKGDIDQVMPAWFNLVKQQYV